MFVNAGLDFDFCGRRVFLRGDAGTAKQGERRDVLTLVRDVSVFGVQVWSNGNTRPLRQSPRRIIVC